MGGGWQRVGQYSSEDIEAISKYTGDHDCGNKGHGTDKATCTNPKSYCDIKHKLVIRVGENRLKDGRRRRSSAPRLVVYNSAARG
jgi:hypothetical protein